MKKIAIALVVLVVIFSLGFYGFDQLGGNNPIQIEWKKSPPPTLSGRTFRGIPQDERLGKTFQEVQSLLAIHPGTSLHTLYSVEPAGKLDTLEVFVGLDLPFPTGDLESKPFTETSYLLATITANKWVMPSPTTVKEKLEEFARGKNLTLSGVFIDKIISEGEVQVIAPIR
jgi:hypothetical protein